MTTVAIAVPLMAFIAAAVLTGLVRRAALRSGLLDHPNERSSHVVPTPRGGGLAIVVVVLAAVIWWTLRGTIPVATALGLLLGGGLVAAIGFLDDRGHVPAHHRLLVHLVALGGALLAAGGLPPVRWGSALVDLGPVGDAFAVLACAWFLNLFNFMDGIDGIAAAEGAFVSFAAAALVAAGDGSVTLVALWATLGAASLGFLAWNWPPARIFMGDVGSGFLGFAMALLLVVSTASPQFSIWTALILVAPFVADATVTLLRRVARGDRWYSAHRSHAYQRLSRRWGGHLRVTLLFLGLNLALVLPAAWWSTLQLSHGPPVAAALYALLVAAAWLVGAGRHDTHDTEGVCS